jgi:glycosyltransferase involved in cell wall biosynthesis
MTPKISAVILTQGKSEKFKECLDSLLWCDEIIVIKDKNKFKGRNEENKRKEGNIKYYSRDLNNNFATQRNFGLKKASNDWVLFIDDDEIVSKSLMDEIISRLDVSEKMNLKGFYLKRNDIFMGRSLKYGEAANVRLLRLACKSAGIWKGRVHEKWSIPGNTDELGSPLIHYPHDSIRIFLNKINNYTDDVAQSWTEEGRKVSFFSIIVKPAGKFLYNYLILMGFLDGIPGLINAMMMSFHSFLARGKLWQMNIHNEKNI